MKIDQHTFLWVVDEGDTDPPTRMTLSGLCDMIIGRRSRGMGNGLEGVMVFSSESEAKEATAHHRVVQEAMNEIAHLGIEELAQLVDYLATAKKDREELEKINRELAEAALEEEAADEFGSQ
jgi:phosphoribosylaminoimidazole (AIR) synthetase